MQALRTLVRVAGWPLALIVGSITLMPQPAANAFPPPIPVTPAFTYQGVLMSGGAAYNGTADVQFSLWDAPGGGVIKAGPIQVTGLAITNGQFTAEVNFGTAQFNGQERWLQIDVHTPSSGGAGPWQALSSRQRFAPVPYALHALSIGGVQSGAVTFDNSDNSFRGASLNINNGSLFVDPVSGNVSIGTEYSPVPLKISRNNTTAPLLELNTDTDNTAALRLITPTRSWLVGQSRPLDHANLTDAFYITDEEVSATRLMIDVVGNVGINTATPAARLHVNSGTAFTGIMGFTDLSNGVAVRGEGGMHGGYFTTSAQGSRALMGLHTAVLGGGYGVYGQSNAGDGAGVVGSSTSIIGQSSGVAGQTASNAGAGVKGFATSATGLTFGVYGESLSSGGRGVYGRGVDGVYGFSNALTGRGVVGWAPAAGATYGVYGQVDNGAGYGVWAQGRMGASGVKSFRIDHPDDPANRYLLHYSAESNEVINFYSGKVTLNGAGEAIVDLPSYFSKINIDPRYTLTAIGAAMPSLHVAEEISDGMLASGGSAGSGLPAACRARRCRGRSRPCATTRGCAPTARRSR